MLRSNVSSREALREKLELFEKSQAEEAECFRRLQEINFQLMTTLAHQVEAFEQGHSELSEKLENQSARIQELEENCEILEHNKSRLQKHNVSESNSFLPSYNVSQSDLAFGSIEELLYDGIDDFPDFKNSM